MAIGANANLGGLSYLAIGRETTLGTYTTATSAVDFLSEGMKVTREKKILEQVQRNRFQSKLINLGKSVEGEISMYPVPKDTSTAFLLAAGFGGSITSATATGETIGGLGFTHTIEIGSQSDTYSSLCINERKGDSTNGKIWEYNGVRVNELTLAGELDEPLMMTVGLMGMDATQTTNDVESVLGTSNNDCLSFVGGRFSVESTFASLTSSSFWHVQSMEFKLINNLKGDSEARRIGSDSRVILPHGMAAGELKATIRFDTTTAYDAMINATQFSAEFEFLGNTMTTSVIKEGLKIQMPKVFVNESGMPEIGGPDEILTSEVTFSVLRDSSSSTGWAVQALLTNNIANYN